MGPSQFSLPTAPFLCGIVAAHHGGPPGWPRSSSVVVLLGIGSPILGGSLGCVGAPIGAPTGCFNAAAVQRRLVLRVRCRLAGGVVGSLLAPCFEYSCLSGMRSVLRVSLVLASLSFVLLIVCKSPSFGRSLPQAFACFGRAQPSAGYGPEAPIFCCSCYDSHQ